MNPSAGFERIAAARGELWVAGSFTAAAGDLGLADRSRWEKLLGGGEAGGRGKVAFVEAGGRHVVLKQLRRGGAAGAIWRERFASRRRLLANLSVSERARERGVATPAALALLLVSGPPGLWRGWLATEAVPGASSMRQLVAGGKATAEAWSKALRAIRRLHDAGIEHPDLNLGNLLIDGAGRGWVVDLDRCTAHPEALDLERRIDALRRIERSYSKICYSKGLEPPESIDWPATYAPGDDALGDRWIRRAAQDLAKLKRHRRGWRR